MGTLHLVRHGQASFGAADYDQLSALGERQCVQLGRYWRGQGLRFDAVLRGTLKRHAQSLAAINEGFGDLPEALLRPGLNEYDSEAVIRAIHPKPLQRATNPEEVRAHFRLLREGLQAWMRGETRPDGMPSYAAFSAGVAAALDEVRAMGDGRVLIVSSGGPISTALAQVLAVSAETSVELNLRIRNASVTEFAFTPKRHALVGFNAVGHLEAEPGLISYA